MAVAGNDRKGASPHKWARPFHYWPSKYPGGGAARAGGKAPADISP
ncbi:hypothetical protein SAMN05444714_0242 [Yoonia litorea]|uniref:Uncharacterized protein n=1 Tax=Yoonia litorea TaxID=1123755 RepID=A0A1I6L6J6_9RHOB|nr:hypothetical protein SAMN05444714_0242 [Yoonia litorea]